MSHFRFMPKTKPFLYLICLLSVSFGVSAKDINFLPTPKKLSEHVYVWVGPLDIPTFENKGFRMNMAFVVGNKMVAVIDTGYTEDIAHDMIKHIRKITPLPIKYAINTNSQPHRFMGNDVFRKAGAQVITHKNSSKRMARLGDNFAGQIENILQLPENWVRSPKKPTKTFNKTLTLNLGGISITLKSYGPTHTSDESVVEILADKIVYTGDILYSGRLPAVLPDSNVSNWLLAYKQLRSYGDITFIPGHGEPSKLSAFEFPTYSYLKHLHDHISKAIEDLSEMGDTLSTLDQHAYKDLVNYNHLAGRNASWAFVTLEAQAL